MMLVNVFLHLLVCRFLQTRKIDRFLRFIVPFFEEQVRHVN